MTVGIANLFNLKILVCSNSCFKFVKSFIGPCNAVKSDCILKVCDTINSKLSLIHSALLRFVHYQSISCSLCRQYVGIFVNKPLTSSHQPLNNARSCRLVTDKPKSHDWFCPITKADILQWTKVAYKFVLLYIMILIQGLRTYLLTRSEHPVHFFITEVLYLIS